MNVPVEVLTLRTSRLILRPWRDDDLPRFAQLNADPSVMEHFPGVLTRAESDQLAARIIRHFAERGFGLWAVEVPEVASFAGFVGLAVPQFEAHFTPCVEIGWRLARQHWGRGYATEAAGAAMAFAFIELGLDEVVSFTPPGNRASRRVMEKLGMSRSQEEDFDQPSLAPGHPLRRHVLFRLRRGEWVARQLL